MLHDTAPDLDPLIKTSGGNCGARAFKVSLDRVDADARASRTCDERDQVARITATDIEKPALWRQERQSEVKEEVGGSRSEALVEKHGQFRVVVSVDELHPLDLLPVHRLSILNDETLLRLAHHSTAELESRSEGRSRRFEFSRRQM